MNVRGLRVYIAFAMCIAASAYRPVSAEETDSRESPCSAQVLEGQQAKHSDDSILSVLSLPSEDISVEQWMRERGWRVQRGNIELYRIENGSLFMRNVDATTVIGKEFEQKIDPEELPLIEFKVLVDEIPLEADVTTRSMDDSALRLFILFDKGGGLLSPPETIGYVWDSTMERGETGRSGRFDQIRYIVIGSGANGLGEWNCFERNIVDDYELLFGSGKIPDISAVCLKCDSNHSGTAAASAIKWIRLKTAKPEQLRTRTPN